MEWSDIQGWFDFQDIYDEQVRTATDGAHFVEVGAWLGRSTAYMAKAIKESGKRIDFDAVDNWQGGVVHPANAGAIAAEVEAAGGSVYKQFLTNMLACGLGDYVNPIKGDSSTTASQYADESLDFVFIDGGHTTEEVTRDLDAYWPKIKPGGVLAGHDINEAGPRNAVAYFLHKTAVPGYQQGGSFVLRKPSQHQCKIFLALPTYGQMNPAAVMAATVYPTASKHQVEILPGSNSLLAHGFNKLWVQALEGNYTHFAMLHSDCVPQRFWLDILVDELLRTGADVIGVVSPLKDDRGLTSTGIGQDEAHWYSPKKRFAMKEIMALPETFDAADAGYPGEPLLLNTGCWMADLRNSKWQEEDEDGFLKIYFTIQDRVWRHKATDKRVVGVRSEDWFFSRKVHDAGLKAMLTRKVQLVHQGGFDYPNFIEWGGYAVDEDTRPNWDQSLPTPA